MHLIRIKRKIDYRSFCAFDHKEIMDDEIWYDRDAKVVFHVGCPPIVLEPRTGYRPPNVKEITQKMTQQQQITTYRPKVQDQEVKTLDVQSHLLKDVTDLFDGKFTVPITYSNGSHEHAVVWLKTMGKDARYPGSKRIRIHLGRHDNVDFLDAAYIDVKGYLNWRKDFQNSNLTDERRKGAIAAIELVVQGKENAELAMKYAMLARKCWHCNRDLTSEITLKRIEETGGLGPVCANKYPHLLEKIQNGRTNNHVIVSFNV